MEIPCIVEKVAFRKDNFAILACNLDPYSYKYTEALNSSVRPFVHKKYKTFTITCDTLAEDERPEGNSYVFVGDFVEDPKWGKQYKASGYYQDVPTTEKGMKKFLMSLPNIKLSRAQDIMRKFKLEEIIGILDNSPEKLLDIPGITKKRLTPIIDAWNKTKHKRELYEWFMSCNIPLKLADAAYEKWKNKTKQKLSDNPYLLTKLRGIGFHKADIIAHRISSDINPSFRLTSCLIYCLREDSQGNGNLCTPYATLKANVVKELRACDASLGNAPTRDYGKDIPELIKDPLGAFSAVKDLKEGLIFVYLKETLEKEQFIAETITGRFGNESSFTCSDAEIKDAEGNISFFLNKEITLDETQKEAIKSAFDNKVTIITGGGGTGKSTICRCIYYLAQKNKMSVNMMSPTGKAAKVLSLRTGGGATTIHRGLGITPDSSIPAETITQDILLVDEISMSGIDTMYALMVAIESNPKANIVFVGDKNQLPSVSPGNFLTDLIKSEACNVVTLNKIHRQDENSYISLIANDISKGVVTEIPEIASDISWYDLNAQSIERDIVKFIDGYLDAGNEINDIQVISPMKKGSCGVHRLNEVIQERMAERNDTLYNVLEREFKKFHLGDRVIQTANNYEKSVFNGDMGVIHSLGEKIKDPTSSDLKEKFIEVDYDGKMICYYGKEIEELLLAWVITVHKFQGSQSKNIVMILASEASVMMSKELVYTGFTRAEKHLYVFGHDQMYRLAPTRSSIKRRFTNLNNMIQEITTGETILKVT